MNSTIERTFCSGCGTFRFKEPEQLCYHCSRGAKVECSGGASAPPEQTEPITFGGATIDAPGFTADQFERAMCRAIADDLVVSIDATGQHIVGPAGVNGGYRTTRTSCDCKAGSCGQACKHRAQLIVYLDVREPALRRQWAAAERNVSRKAAAA